jgi:hypothetical protein
MELERDLTDLGVKWVAPPDPEPEPPDPEPGPPASAEQRAAALAQIRQEQGWGPGAGDRLAAACRCGAQPFRWCPRREGRPGVVGYVHDDRGATT